jgi:GlcNAc-P-P-Und epimerase
LETVLITGASGFLGRSIFYQLKNEFRVITIGRNLVSHSDQHLFYDFSENNLIDIPAIDCIIHCASRVHTIPKNEREAEAFFTVNVQGTSNLLRCLETNQSLKKFIFISSVAVYGLVEGNNIKEDTALLAVDPYGKSKIIAERIISYWCKKRSIELYIFRLPLVAGRNPPGNLGSMIRGIKSGKYFSIGKAEAKKSMILAEDLGTFLSSVKGPPGAYNLTDGYHPSFYELENMISLFYSKKKPFCLPMIAAKILAFSGNILGSKFPINSGKLKKIKSTLTFDDTKARTLLGWKPSEVLKAWEIE